MIETPKTKDQRLITILSLGIDDSKRLSPKERKELVPQIERYFYCGVGEASVWEIHRYGIVEATQKAMRRAVRSLWSFVISHSQNNKTDMNRITHDQRLTTNDSSAALLLDAFFLPRCCGFPLTSQQAIIKGDQKSISIAAASIIAKVYRDGLMEQLAKKYSLYRWEKNKGYGTALHREAIGQNGLSALHRRSFIHFSCNTA